MSHKSYVAVIDCGSQTTKLIARRIRELGVFSRVLMPSVSPDYFRECAPDAIILSGGPQSVLERNSIRIHEDIYEMGIPILGICYGMQMLVHHFGGTLENCIEREFGERHLSINPSSKLFKGIDDTEVWMSHSDQAKILPPNFIRVAHSATCENAAIEHTDKKICGVQFHPEVSHTKQGCELLKNFLFSIAEVNKSFDLNDFLSEKIASIKDHVGDSRIIMGLSGGVDSMVAAALINRAVGKNLHCVYVNHGLHRAHEVTEVSALFEKVFGRPLCVVNAEEQFFSALTGVLDPEQKRKIIGRVFIEIFEQEARRSNATFLGQGTLYPDVIESPNTSGGHSHGIKSHHNVGGLPKNMNLKLVEPLRELFKDEVRALGRMLGLDDAVVMREPFPGPGLAVRVPGEVTKERVERVRAADHIVREEIHKANLGDIWQSFAILLPVRSVGVMGDARAYGEAVVVRSVTSNDAMTADWSKLSHELLGRISTRITNEVAGVNRVLYDITQKPPGTIEWE